MVHKGLYYETLQICNAWISQWASILFLASVFVTIKRKYTSLLRNLSIFCNVYCTGARLRKLHRNIQRLYLRLSCKLTPYIFSTISYGIWNQDNLVKTLMLPLVAPIIHQIKSKCTKLTPVDHRHLSNIDCLMACTACLVCFISTVNGRSKKKRKEAY